MQRFLVPIQTRSLMPGFFDRYEGFNARCFTTENVNV